MEIYDKQFNLYLRIARKYAIALPDEKERIKALKWLQKIHATTDEKAKKSKNHALKLLIICLQRKRLVGPFESVPEDKPLIEHRWEYQPADIAKLILEYEFQKAGKPPVSIEVSGNVCEFVAYQDIPSFGGHFFYAYSPEKIRKWDNLNTSLLPRGLLDISTVSSPDTSILARSVRESARKKREHMKKVAETSQKKRDQFVDVSLMLPSGQMKEDFVSEAPQAKDVDVSLIGTAIDGGIINKKDVDVSRPFKSNGEKVKVPLEETVKVEADGQETTSTKQKNVGQHYEPVAPREPTDPKIIMQRKRARREIMLAENKKSDKPVVYLHWPIPKNMPYYTPQELGLADEGSNPDDYPLRFMYVQPDDPNYQVNPSDKHFHLAGVDYIDPDRLPEPKEDYLFKQYEKAKARAQPPPLEELEEKLDDSMDIPAIERSNLTFSDRYKRSALVMCQLTPIRGSLLERLNRLKDIQAKSLAKKEANKVIEAEEVAFDKFLNVELGDKESLGILKPEEMYTEDLFGEDCVKSPSRVCKLSASDDKSARRKPQSRIPAPGGKSTRQQIQYRSASQTPTPGDASSCRLPSQIPTLGDVSSGLTLQGRLPSKLLAPCSISGRLQTTLSSQTPTPGGASSGRPPSQIPAPGSIASGRVHQYRDPSHIPTTGGPSSCRLPSQIPAPGSIASCRTPQYRAPSQIPTPGGPSSCRLPSQIPAPGSIASGRVPQYRDPSHIPTPGGASSCRLPNQIPAPGGIASGRTPQYRAPSQIPTPGGPSSCRLPSKMPVPSGSSFGRAPQHRPPSQIPAPGSVNSGRLPSKMPVPGGSSFSRTPQYRLPSQIPAPGSISSGRLPSKMPVPGGSSIRTPQCGPPSQIPASGSASFGRQVQGRKSQIPSIARTSPRPQDGFDECAIFKK